MDLPTGYDPNRLLTEREVAALTALSHRSLQGWRQRGGGPPYVKWGRAVRYRLSDISEWMGRNTRARTSGHATLDNEPG